MRQAVDGNVLVNAHLPTGDEEHRIRRFLLERLNTPGFRIVVTPITVHEFIHVATDPHRFSPPISMAEALAVARLYVGKSNVEFLGTDEEAMGDALSLAQRCGLQGDRIADALFVATLLKNDVREIITTSPEDYEAFDELKVINPLEIDV